MYFKVVNGAIEINAKRILEEINLEIKDKDHVAIIGRNGAGKSTLLKSFVDTSLLEEGIGEDKFSITILDHPIIGFLKQNEGYHGDLTLLQYILQVYEPLILLEKKMEKLEKKMEAGIISALEFDQYVELQEAYKNQGGYLYKKEYLTALAKNGFQDSDLNKKLSSFSGGELTKISFLRLLLSKPDLLLLDEPTNHLDILSKEKLESLLLHYPGTILFVSHDRYFISKLADSILEFDYKITYYDYRYEEYLEKKEQNREIVLPIIEEKKVKTSKKKNVSFDKKISDLEKKIDDLKKQLFLEEVYLDIKKYQEVAHEITVLENKLELLLEKWD